MNKLIVDYNPSQADIEACLEVQRHGTMPIFSEVYDILARYGDEFVSPVGCYVGGNPNCLDAKTAPKGTRFLSRCRPATMVGYTIAAILRHELEELHPWHPKAPPQPVDQYTTIDMAKRIAKEPCIQALVDRIDADIVQHAYVNMYYNTGRISIQQACDWRIHEYMLLIEKKVAAYEARIEDGTCSAEDIDRYYDQLLG